MSDNNGDNTKRDEGQEFAPNTDNDHRNVGEWKTRYARAAYIQIVIETLYILTLFISSLAGLAYLKCHNSIPDSICFSATSFPSYRKAGFAILGGLLGGVLFDMKWLYHSVAHGIWNQDRCLWRLLTPLISSGLAFAFYVIIKSGIITVINTSSAERPASIVAISFLVGYFSDSALAKMYEVATTLFGSVSRGGSEKRNKKKPGEGGNRGRES